MSNDLVTGWLVDRVAHSLADRSRREILQMLRDRPLTAGALAAAFSVSRPAISRHLRVLRESGLVHDTIHGRERIYQIRVGALQELATFISNLSTPSDRWERRFAALETEVQRVRKKRRAARRASGASRGTAETDKTRKRA